MVSAVKRRAFSSLAIIAVVLLGALFSVGCTPKVAEHAGEGGAQEPVTVAQTPEVVTRILTTTPAPTLTTAPMADKWTPGQLEIHVLDVQHGDAQLIVSPSGETLLIDVGREEYKRRLSHAPDNIKMIKLCDTLHNVEDMENLSMQGILRKIYDCRDYYIPMARELCPDIASRLESHIEDYFRSQSDLQTYYIAHPVLIHADAV